MAEYIDREDFCENICKCNKNGCDKSQCAIWKTPTADVEKVRHGKWLPQIVAGVKAWDCSECNTLGSPHWKRCPICEAKMDGGKEE